MTDCRSIVNGALRKLGKLAGGREPRVQDSTDALESLQGIYRSLITSGAFGRLYDVVPTSDYTAGENERVFRNSDAVLNVSLPELVQDYGEPLSYDQEVEYYSSAYPFPGGQRPPRDGAVIAICDAFTGETVEYIYDGQQKLWQSIYDLSLTSTAPLARRDPDGLKSLLAMQISDEFGGTLGPMTVRQAQNFQMALTHGYDSPEYARSRGVTTVASSVVPVGSDAALKFNVASNSMYLGIPFGPTISATLAALKFNFNSNSMYVPLVS